MSIIPRNIQDKLPRILWLMLILYLLVDLGYSFVQHYQKPIGGDLAQIVLPTPGAGYYQVQQDPFALDVLKGKKKYSNPNRYFAYKTTSLYFKSIPLVLQNFTTPISSVYLSIALIKTFTQLLLILLLALYILPAGMVRSWEFFAALVLMTPLFQTDGYNSSMGVIDHSVVYTMFYALPLALVLLFYLPFYSSSNKKKRGFKAILQGILLTLLMVYLSLNGPLVPGVVLVGAPLILLYQIIRNFPTANSSSLVNKIWQSFKRIPNNTKYFLMGFMLLCLYSLYIGRFDIMNLDNEIPLVERYGRLITGIFSLFTIKLGLPLLLSAIVINLIILARTNKTAEGKRLLVLAAWIGVFAILYLGLLPLGGFRTYRPQIIRYDTLLPITLGFFFLFGITSLYLLKHLITKSRYIYIPWIVLVLFVFANSDRNQHSAYDCERFALETISISDKEVVELDCLCPVMEFRIVHDPDHSGLKADLLYYWHVTNNKKLFYQIEGCE